MRLEIWHRIGLSGDCDVFAQRYALVVVHAAIGLIMTLGLDGTIGH